MGVVKNEKSVNFLEKLFFLPDLWYKRIRICEII